MTTNVLYDSIKTHVTEMSNDAVKENHNISADNEITEHTRECEQNCDNYGLVLTSELVTEDGDLCRQSNEVLQSADDVSVLKDDELMQSTTLSDFLQKRTTDFLIPETYEDCVKLANELLENSPQKPTCVKMEDRKVKDLASVQTFLVKSKRDFIQRFGDKLSKTFKDPKSFEKVSLYYSSKTLINVQDIESQFSDLDVGDDDKHAKIIASSDDQKYNEDQNAAMTSYCQDSYPVHLQDSNPSEDYLNYYSSPTAFNIDNSNNLCDELDNSELGKESNHDTRINYFDNYQDYQDWYADVLYQAEYVRYKTYIEEMLN